MSAAHVHQLVIVAYLWEDRAKLQSLRQTACKLLLVYLRMASALLQEYGSAMKIVKIEADPCPNLMEQYKARPLPTFVQYACICPAHCSPILKRHTFDLEPLLVAQRA